MENTPLTILKKYWHYDAFRPMQSEIIESVLSGKDTLGLLPTGGGKSVCFQIPGLINEGVCVVVSPLIALMKDQVHNLKKRGIAAEAVFSGMDYKEIDRIFDNAVFGHLKFLYLSPERLTTEMAAERLSKMNINLWAVDEAHCISQWGYDFRPPYLLISEIRKLHPAIPVLALTATATPEVVDDIQEKLSFKEKNVFKNSFKRDNLAYVVLEEENKNEKLLDILKKVPGSAVVYARNRKLTKEISLFLQKNGLSADFYHAGLSNVERSKKQDDWILNKTRIMVSTNAFGMGIDKPDVRVVVHLDLPDNLEAYFQEAGRAGRDGKKSYAVLLYANTDKINLLHNFEISFPAFEEIRRTYQALGSYFQIAVGGGQGQSYDFDLVEFCKNFQLETVRAFNCLQILEKEGWLSMTEAVYTPATLRFVVERETLYDFQIKNPKFDSIIKTLLRAHDGILNHLVPVNEKRVAKFMKIAPEALVDGLNRLAKEGIIEYHPQRDKPQLIFTRERVDAQNLEIDTKMYRFRKERQQERIEKAIAYATTQRCRSQQLLQYFGETEAAPCKICDVCLGRSGAELSNEDYRRFKEKIITLLKKEKLTETHLIESFHSRHAQKVLRALEFMLDEKLVVQEAGKLSLSNKN